MSSMSDSPPPLPEAGNDPGDPNAPQHQLSDPPTPPLADPTRDMDMDDIMSDNDSVLSDIDEAQFEDFDPENVAIEERPKPVLVDEDNVKLLGRHKRKRVEGEDGDGEVKKKKKEGRREKKLRKKKDSDDGFSGGDELDGKRARKDPGVRRERKTREATPENDEDLDPETRRRRALDRAMDAALKNPSKRRRRADGIDLNTMADEEIASLRTRMASAAELDVQARAANPPRPAMHKLQLLPEVTALLNRNGREIENAIVDPENNLLESVRFFLEPLNDGSLPAYNIQRELFASLLKLPINKEALISSGIGKVVLFYTKSKKPELTIKRQAERLLAEWTRPILKRSDDYRKREFEVREYNPAKAKMRNSLHKGASQASAEELAAAKRRLALAPPSKGNRARLETEVKTYTVVPRNNLGGGGGPQADGFGKSYGADVDAAFRRVKARNMAALGKGPKR